MKLSKEKSELGMNQKWNLGIHSVFLIVLRGLKCEEALMRHLIMLSIILWHHSLCDLQKNLNSIEDKPEDIQT